MDLHQLSVSPSSSSAGRNIFTERQAAEYLAISLPTLQRLRRSHTGPEAVVMGRRLIRYRKAALDAYLDQHTRWVQ